MKFYKLSEQDIIKLINLGRLSVTYEISDIPDDFKTELSFDGQDSIELEEFMNDGNVSVEIID